MVHAGFAVNADTKQVIAGYVASAARKQDLL